MSDALINRDEELKKLKVFRFALANSLSAAETVSLDGVTVSHKSVSQRFLHTLIARARSSSRSMSISTEDDCSENDIFAVAMFLKGKLPILADEVVAEAVMWFFAN